ncbi:hypothetical protein [Bradyrhizobium sp. 76]|uniref:hypothetical protein n=1 Tax=Bradyrhizobium sp. 76 TaxID=2782680 RepID=UPI001FF94DC3|nr:hypothetical protein [Bradyrhizobium sp. 76]MCK1404911.1 hypothetical protein [Bradyrhizobium sp. 76]
MKRLIILFLSLFCVHSAHASSFFSFSGYVSADTTFFPPLFPGYTFTEQTIFGAHSLVGTPFQITETFYSVPPPTPYDVGFADITIGGVTGRLTGNFGSIIPVAGGFSTGMITKGDFTFSSETFAELYYSSTFGANGLTSTGQFTVTNGAFGRTFDFAITSQSQTVSAVPLPSALPLFGAAILALGAVGFCHRKKSIHNLVISE